MKKLFLLMVGIILLATAVCAIDLENNTWYYPSLSNKIYIVNSTATGIDQVLVNETCLIINTTPYCNVDPPIEWIYTIDVYISNGTFYFIVSGIGIEWVKTSWNSTGITAEYSLDNLTWQNLSTITNTYGMAIPLPSGTEIYIRAKNISHDFGYIQNTTLAVLGEEDDMQLSLVLGIGIIAVILFWLAYKVDDEHFILRMLFILSGFTVLILIPLSTFMDIENIGRTFYRVFLYIFVAFWLYVIGYFVYYIIKKMNKNLEGGGNE